MAFKKLTPKKYAELAADLARVWWRLLPHAKNLRESDISVYSTARPVINKHLGPPLNSITPYWQIGESFFLQEGDDDPIYYILEALPGEDEFIIDTELRDLEALRKYMQSGAGATPLPDPTPAFHQMLGKGVKLKDLGKVTRGQMRLALAFREAVGPMVVAVRSDHVHDGKPLELMLVFDGGSELADEVLFSKAWRAVEDEFGDGARVSSYNNWSATVRTQ